MQDGKYTLAHPRDYCFHARTRSPMHIIVWDSGRTLCGLDPSRGIWDGGIEDIALSPEGVVEVPRLWCVRCWKSFAKRHPAVVRAIEEVKEEVKVAQR